MKNNPARKRMIEDLEARRLLASTFTATLEPLNNSGVSGTAEFTLDGDQLTVTVNARGLEPNQVHPQHIHGLVDDDANESAESRIPSLTEDADRDGIIEHLEASIATGPSILPLSSPPASDAAPEGTAPAYPTATAEGVLTFTQVYNLADPTQFFDPETDTDFTGPQLLPLERRVIELHGMTLE